MAASSFVPPQKQELPQQEVTPAGLLGPGQNVASGQQLSSFTELKQGLKSRTLFGMNDSPLKTD